jgi:hypothetical protein
MRDGSGVVQKVADRVGDLPDFDDRARPARDADHRRGQSEAPDGFVEPVVVGEDDDLAGSRGVRERARQPLDPRRVHGLHRIIDGQKPERTFGERRSRKEQAQGQRVQLSLAHHAQRFGRSAVHGYLQRDPPALRRPLQHDAAQEEG